MRWIAALLLATLMTGCGLGGCRVSFEPLAVEQSGVVVLDPADGPPVECRGLPVPRCDIGFTVLGGRADDDRFAPADVDRVVVACVGTCTPQGGETRIEVILDGGESVLLANGGYGEFEQSCS